MRAQNEQQELALHEAEWWDDLESKEADSVENDMDDQPALANQQQSKR